MSSPCRQFADEWDLLVLGALDEARSHAMRAHVAAGCVSCRARLADATTLVAEVGASLEEMEPPASVEGQLLLRATAIANASGGRPPATVARAAPADANGRPRALLIAATIAALLCGWLAWQNLALRRGLDEARRAAANATASPPSAPQVSAPPRATPREDASTPPPLPVAPPLDARARDVERRELEARLAQAEAARDRSAAEAGRLQEEVSRLVERLKAPAITPPAAAADVAEERKRVEALQATVERLDADVRRLTAENRRWSSAARDSAALLQTTLDPRSRRVALRPVDVAAGPATALAVLGADGQLVLTTHDLPALGPDKCYQLWVIRRGNPAIVSGGVLDGLQAGRVVHTTRIDGGADLVTGFAITDEPAGGSVASRGRKLLFGATR